MRDRAIRLVADIAEDAGSTTAACRRIGEQLWINRRERLAGVRERTAASQARPNDCLLCPDQPEPGVLRAAQRSSHAIADRAESALGAELPRAGGPLWLR
jgi:hypothetical protein